MIIDIINKLIKPIIIIACISMVITWAFNIQNVLITDINIDEIQMKVVDFRLYLMNLTNAWESNALNFDDVIPPGDWQEVTGSIVDDTFWNALFNNMGYVIQWLYFPINFLLYITRWVAWLCKLLLALIGWNVGKNSNGDYYSTLVQILVWVTQNLKIPYILN